MLFDARKFGGEPPRPWCRACRETIRPGEPVTELSFPNDPDGERGLTGTYHRQCSKPFASLAQALNMMNPWSRF